MTDPDRDLLLAARASWHLLQSLLADRDGATDELIRSIADSLKRAIERAEGKETRHA